ncbi:MAG: hypothetical protein AAGF12_04540 [Myxococcota bacterium]
MTPPARVAALLAWGSLFGLSGCTDLAEFEGSYSGLVVGDGEEVFIRRGFPAETRLQLADFVPPPSAGPVGSLTTIDYDAFSGTRLEQISPLEHDQLSAYDFPGAGRVRNYIFVARPTGGPLGGRDVMVFVSLMDEDSVELRIISGSGDETRGDHYGFFKLERE